MSPVMQVCGCGCGRVVQPGQSCVQSKRADNRRRSQKSKRHGLNTARWQRFRKQRLALSPHCELGLPGCTGASTTVHLDPAMNGDHRLATVSNTKALCASCHGVVDAPRSSYAVF